MKDDIGYGIGDSLYEYRQRCICYFNQSPGTVCQIPDWGKYYIHSGFSYREIREDDRFCLAQAVSQCKNYELAKEHLFISAEVFTMRKH